MLCPSRDKFIEHQMTCVQIRKMIEDHDVEEHVEGDISHHSCFA